MKWSDWPRGTHVESRWHSIVSRGQIPHAFLWVGLEGTGKTPLAWTLSQALLCPHGRKLYPCESCETCKRVERLSYPYLWFIPPTGASLPLEEVFHKFHQVIQEQPFLSLIEWELLLLEKKGVLSIGIESVRYVQSLLKLAVPNSAWRIVIFWHAELMTKQAANALLKVVEEPPPNTLIFFLSTRMEALPTTLRSRCQIWRFPSLTPEELSSLAGEQLSAAYLSMAQGSYGRLRRILDPAQATYINALREWLRGILIQESSENLATAIDTLAQAPRLSELLLMGVSLIRDHPHLSLPQKAVGMELLLKLADEIEANLQPLLLLWETTLALRTQWRLPAFDKSWLSG
ncbi:MAG: hypothetical protein RMJ66_05270 [Bacteroidia bacterium]|nr:hypothetical protein [Bacteroidia bacterium]MDW8134458.1 hypothetical protein [Bacteroidia bacterium]